jgi:UDP-glucose 4-epimerase
MRVLVTGGAGFIGSHLVDALLARGDEVVVLDDLSTGRREHLDARAELVVGSVTEPPALGACELVFHLAAQIDVRRAVADPAFDARVNVGGTAATLELAREWGARRFVLASTGGAIYGDAAAVPTPEDTPPTPISPYGAGKAAAELYLVLYARLHGLSTVALRFANVYGPRQDPRLEGGVVAIFTAAAREGRRGTVFGDGRQTRDFVYVGDVVEALLAAAGSDAGGAFNVGTGRETSVLELAAAVGIEVDHAPERPGEVTRSCLDPTRAAGVLGWRARTTLADGLRATAAA